MPSKSSSSRSTGVRRDAALRALIEEFMRETRHELDVQFKRIAQLQSEVDELRRRLNGGA